MRKLFVVSLLLCLSLQVACTKGNDTTTHAAKEPATKMSNSDLKKMIEEKINAYPELQAAKLDVDADADKNTATISGKVESEALRMKAVESAKAAHAGLVVQDKIDVKPRELTRQDYTPEMARSEVDKAKANKETVGSGIDDAWIHSKIVAKLLTDRDTPEHKINVDVNNNVVTLRGMVDNAEAKAEAERLAKETDGVKRVNNQLKVGAAKTAR